MALSIIQNLGLRNPVRNQLRFGVNATEIHDATVTQSQLLILISDGDRPLENDTLNLDAEIMGGDIVFTFKDTPTGPYELPAYTSGTTQDYVTSLATRMRLITLINNNYILAEVVFGDYGILFTARVDNDARYDVVATPSGFAPSANSATNATVFVPPSNSGLLMQLWGLYDPLLFDDFVDLAAADEFDLLLEEVYPVDDDGNAYMPVEDVLRNLLSPTIPPPGSSTSLVAYDSYMPFYLKASEQYGDPVDVQVLLKSDVKWAYLAGRNQLSVVSVPDWTDVVYDTDLIVHFLSIWPNTEQIHAKTVLPEQEEYLAFIVPKSSFNIIVDLYYETGSPSIGYTLEALTDRAHDLILLPVGMNARSLASIDPTRRLRGYCIYLTTPPVGITPPPGNILSERRWYTVDHYPHERARQLLYWTSAGGVDTIVLHGDRQTSSVVESERSTRVVNEPATMADAKDTVDYVQTIGTECQAGSAYVTQAEQPALADLISSESIQELIDGTWWPVALIGKGTLPLGEEVQGLTSVPIEYRYALRETANSKA